jgi:protein-S-isoprenylcysteine O-methyltransferase Ste14
MHNSDAETRPSNVPWPPIVIVAAVAACVVLGRIYPFDWPGVDDLPARIIGYGLGMAGLALAGWGFLSLRRANTTLLPTRAAGRLVTDGAFAFRRNPIYMGEVLVFLSVAEPTRNVWFVILTPLLAVALYALAIRPEEQHLQARFGQAYLDYMERTRRWF